MNTKAEERRAAGKTYRQIADEMGVSVSTVHRWLNPNSRERNLRHSREAKRRRKKATCCDCGKKLAYDRQDNKRCRLCQHEAKYGEENRAIDRFWKQGKTGEQIADELGLSAVQVRSRVNYRREQGQSVSMHRTSNRNLWAEIEPLWRQGLTATEIGKRVGLGRDDVNSRIQGMRKAGIDLPYRRIDLRR